ncbi:MAG: M6 family metalloprotease domain-containing protein [Spirochaetes bacterium]|nr:M6 family metalloprotease domain-containing protein [Spirochaetota bacterium]
MAMVFKKSVFTLFLMLFFAVGAGAMPPHPLNTRPTERAVVEIFEDGEEPLYKSIVRNAPAFQAFGAPGAREMNLLVILADFGADLAAQPVGGVPFGGGNNFKNKYGYVILVLVLMFLLMQIFFRSRKRYLFLNACLLVVLSCSDGFIVTSGGHPGTRLDFNPKSKEVIKNVLGANNAAAPIPLSMKQYWKDMSNNNLILNIDVVGPVKVSMGWQYYGRNNRHGRDSFPGQFVSEAVRLAFSRGYVRDFAKYDNNNDGFVDVVFVVFAGPGEEQWGVYNQVNRDAIWSHFWNLNSARQFGDGNGAIFLGNRWINRYIVAPEYIITPGDTTIGVFCHEFAHALGLPDLYDTTRETHGVGAWSLMAAGAWGSGSGKDPAPLLAWERYFLGGSDWITINTLTDTKRDFYIGDNVYKIPLNARGTQYLMLERKTYARGAGNKYVPASGVLITHIDEDIIRRYRRPNRVNAGRHRVHGVNIVEAFVPIGTDASGGRGALWKNPNTGSFHHYSNMVFPATAHSQTYNQIHAPFPGADFPFPNSNYYISESVLSKSGYSGISVTVTSENRVTVEFP